MEVRALTQSEQKYTYAQSMQLVQNVTLIGVFCCHTYVAVIHA